MQEQSKPNIAVVVIIAVALIGLLATGVWISRRESSPTTTTTMTETTPPATETSVPTATSGTYQNGTYSAEGTYGTPGGQESVDVKLTLADGKVSDITVTGSGKGGESEEYQGKFISGYKQLVVGKSIDSIVLDRVAGSSLTSDGFNDAIQRIKEQADAA